MSACNMRNKSETLNRALRSFNSPRNRSDNSGISPPSKVASCARRMSPSPPSTSAKSAPPSARRCTTGKTSTARRSAITSSSSRKTSSGTRPSAVRTRSAVTFVVSPRDKHLIGQLSASRKPPSAARDHGECVLVQTRRLGLRTISRRSRIYRANCLRSNRCIVTARVQRPAHFPAARCREHDTTWWRFSRILTTHSMLRVSACALRRRCTPCSDRTCWRVHRTLAQVAESSTPRLEAASISTTSIEADPFRCAARITFAARFALQRGFAAPLAIECHCQHARECRLARASRSAQQISGVHTVMRDSTLERVGDVCLHGDGRKVFRAVFAGEGDGHLWNLADGDRLAGASGG